MIGELKQYIIKRPLIIAKLTDLRVAMDNAKVNFRLLKL